MGERGFIGYCLEKHVPRDLLEDVMDDFVDRYYDTGSSEPLSEFLGMSPDEYALWVERPEALPFILRAHQVGAPVEWVINRAVESKDFAEQAESLRSWLKYRTDVIASRPR